MPLDEYFASLIQVIAIYTILFVVWYGMKVIWAGMSKNEADPIRK